MKYLLSLFFLPSLALAQAPSASPEQMQPPPSSEQKQQMQPPPFDEKKAQMQPMFEKSLPAMKQTRECVAKAKSKEEVEECMNTMAEMAKEFQKQTGVQGPSPTTEAPEGFEWNEQTKQSMLKSMDVSIRRTNFTLECLGQSNNSGEMGNCMRRKLQATSKKVTPREKQQP